MPSREGFLFTDELFKRRLLSLLSGSVLVFLACVCVFMLRVRTELGNYRLCQKVSQGVKIKGAFTCSRAEEEYIFIMK